MVRPLAAVQVSALPGEEAPAAPPSPARAAHDRRALLLLAVAAAAAAIVWVAPFGLDPRVQHALAVSTFMVMAWITNAVDHAVAGFIGCYAFWALGIVNFQVAFAGFAETTPWFLFGALLFGVMATKSGLARRLAFMVMRGVGHSYARLLLGLILSDFILTFIVPSGIARVVIMAAVALGLIEAFGVGSNSNIARGMFIILTYTASIFDKMIIAGAASITARGLIERVGQVEVLWSRWFLAYLPCDLITIFVAWRLTLRLYPPERTELPGGANFLGDTLRRMGPWTALEIRSAALMTLAIALWMTDFLHHLPAPMIGLGVGLFAVLPVVGVLDTNDLRRVNYLPIFFVAAAVSMGQVLATTRALNVLTDVLFGWMEPHITDVFRSTLILYWTAFLYHIPLGDEVSMLATSIPVLMQFARTHGLDPLALGMVWTFGAGAKIFVYQSAVMVVGYSYGCFDARDLLKVGGILTVVESLILLFLVPFYWPMIGI
jgi:solute carrier family 13 (sodium-dependent dicarboxylate transporter), member 2/3/5